MDDSSVRWRPVTRIAFRFCFLYFGLYILLTMMFLGTLVGGYGYPPLVEPSAGVPPTNVTFWRMDDTLYTLPAQVDLETKTLTLWEMPSGGRKKIGTFAINPVASDRMVFDGELEGRKIRMETHLFPREKFLLVSRGFNWIQETSLYP